jgi:large subunit ribosomal protein L13
VDADGAVLGRMASKIAPILMGKNKPTYTPHVDTGDYVVVVNAEKIQVTGNKAKTKEYDYYTHHPGGHKFVSFADMMAKKPERVIELAVRRMLPKNKLGRKMLKKLKGR